MATQTFSATINVATLLYYFDLIGPVPRQAKKALTQFAVEFYPTPDVKQCVLASGSRVVRISTNSVTIPQPTLCVMSLLRGDEEGEEGAKSQ